MCPKALLQRVIAAAAAAAAAATTCSRQPAGKKQPGISVSVSTSASSRKVPAAVTPSLGASSSVAAAAAAAAAEQQRRRQHFEARRTSCVTRPAYRRKVLFFVLDEMPQGAAGHTLSNRQLRVWDDAAPSLRKCRYAAGLVHRVVPPIALHDMRRECAAGAAANFELWRRSQTEAGHRGAPRSRPPATVGEPNSNSKSVDIIELHSCWKEDATLARTSMPTSPKEISWLRERCEVSKCRPPPRRVRVNARSHFRKS